MKIGNFEKYFDSTILKRGYRYYKDGNVNKVVKNNNTIYAQVLGSKRYNVIIELKSKEYKMECSCPYAKECENCKHMAAVLFYIKNESSIRECNIISYDNTISISELEYYENEFKYELEKLLGWDNYFSWKNGYLFVDLIEKYANLLDSLFIENKELAIELAYMLYYQIENVNMDGSGGEHMQAIECINSRIEKQLENEDFWETYKKIIFRILYSQNLVNFNVYILDPLYGYSTNKKSALKVNKLIDKIYNDYLEDKISSHNIFMDNYKLLKIKNMYKYIDKDKAIEIAFKNIDNIYIANYLIYMLENKKDKEKLIQALEIISSRIIGIDRNGIFDKLLKCYLDIGNIEKYETTLNKVYERNPSFKYYKKIRKLYSKEEWQKISKKVAKKSKKINNVNEFAKICILEKWDEELFNSVKDKSFYTIYEYINFLKKYYNDELIEILGNLIIEEAKTAQIRDDYYEIVNKLLDIRLLKGSKEKIKSIIQLFRESYKRKRAFMEELNFLEELLN